MKLGIIGSGMIVHDFLKTADKINNLELTAISSTVRSKDIARELANQYGIKKTYTDNEKMMVDPDVDTVYVAVPNFLHYEIAKEALEHGKNVICEKPFVESTEQAKELKQLADEKDLIILEAITNLYLENFKQIQKELKNIAPIHIVNMNYTQYSSRYDAFLEGKIAPVFDPNKDGGALMDLNIYNIHFIVGLLGMPKSVEYKANIERGIDTSGVLNLDYGNFKAVLIAAKDCAAPVNSLIEGDEGTIQVDGPANVMDSFDIFKDQDKTHIDEKVYPHRMYEEFRAFEKMIDDHDLVKDKEALDHSDQVMQVVQKAIDSAGLKLE